MYAIIRAGGKQAKVHEGDVLSVERIKDTDTVSFTPLLVVGDDGTVISDRGALAQASVTAEILGASAGPKVDIFKYKAKTGYRRRQGHRQKYTTIKVIEIVAPGVGKKTSKKKAADTSTDATVEQEPSSDPSADAAEAATPATKPAVKKPAAKKPAAKKPAAKTSTATSTASKTAAKKPTTAKSAAKKQAPETPEKE